MRATIRMTSCRMYVLLLGWLLGSIYMTVLKYQEIIDALSRLSAASDATLMPPVDVQNAALLKNTATPSESIPSLVKSRSQNKSGDDRLPRILAIYFPQYHRDPINDKNWGENFTDWVSLQGSPRKNKAGFEIPRPTDLGYYDLTSVEPRRKQGELAKQYGIDGFIYHHYWFYDKEHPGSNLAAPLLNMLEDGHPDMPFFLNWCAVRWVNVWMGKAVFQTIPTNKNRAITLQEQYFDPSHKEIKAHYQWLSHFFKHKNYIRIHNQPVMLLYSFDERAIPIIKKLREMAKKDGFDGIYWIVGRNAVPDEVYVPHNLTERKMAIMKKKTQPLNMFPMDVVFNQSMTYPYPLEWLTKNYKVPAWCQAGRLREEAAPHTRQEVTGILTAFDNTPRRNYREATIYGADTPKNIIDRFRTNLKATLYYGTCCQRQTDDRFLAINAWNEWGEGMALEPSDTYGRGFLETIKKVKQELQVEGCTSSIKEVGKGE